MEQVTTSLRLQSARAISAAEEMTKNFPVTSPWRKILEITRRHYSDFGGTIEWE